MTTERRLNRMRAVIANRQPDLTVVCENIHDPHNVSAILRTCDAVGIEEIHLLYTTEVFPKLGKKSSASAKKWINRNNHPSALSLHSALKEKGCTIYATHLEEDSVSVYDIDWTKPSAIIMGNEHTGVSEEALRIADQIVHIPMAGMIQSLNVSVAAAVILYEAYRQRHAANLYPHSTKTTSQIEKILKIWKEK